MADLARARRRLDRQLADVSALSDVELIRAHAAGHRQAFEVLFHRHKDHLWRTALRVAPSPEDAADALQEALTSAHRTAGAFRADSAVRSWLHAIVVNACLNQIRRNRQHPTTSLDVDLAPEIAHPRDPLTDTALRLDLNGALAKLPPNQRAAVVAVDVYGYSVADAARLLDVPTGTVKSRCARARDKLADTLTSQPGRSR